MPDNFDPKALTENALPRGAMMVLGRSLDGELLAVMLPADDPERAAKIVGALRKVLVFNDGIQNAEGNEGNPDD